MVWVKTQCKRVRTSITNTLTLTWILNVSSSAPDTRPVTTALRDWWSWWLSRWAIFLAAVLTAVKSGHVTRAAITMAVKTAAKREHTAWWLSRRVGCQALYWLKAPCRPAIKFTFPCLHSVPTCCFLPMLITFSWWEIRDTTALHICTMEYEQPLLSHNNHSFCWKVMSISTSLILSHFVTSIIMLLCNINLRI